MQAVYAMVFLNFGLILFLFSQTMRNKSRTEATIITVQMAFNEMVDVVNKNNRDRVAGEKLSMACFQEIKSQLVSIEKFDNSTNRHLEGIYVRIRDLETLVSKRIEDENTTN